MGRPLSDKFWGDSTRPGFQLTLNEAWIPGEASATSNVEILKQSGTRKYIARNTTTSNEGVVFLVNGSVTAEGEANKRVYPWTGVGTGATVGAVTFSVIHATPVTGGTGYVVGDLLTVAGGTGTPAVLEVKEVSSLGTIKKLSVNTSGDYSIIPTNLTSNAVTGGSGLGATVKLVMGLETATVGVGGSGYVNGNYAMAVVSGSNGVGGVLLGTVAGGAVTSWAVIGRGYGFTAETVNSDVFGIGDFEYARTILSTRVKTWQGGNFVWSKNNAATAFGEAVLVTA